MKAFILYSLLFLVSVSLQTQGDAALVLEFGEASVVGDNAYSGSVGQTVIAEIYLTQIGTAILDSPNTALAIADFIVTIDGSNVVPVATTFGPGFVDDGSGNTGVTISTATIAEFVSGADGTQGVTVTADGLDDESVLLGTVSFQIQSGANGTYNLSVSPSPAFSSFAIADSPLPNPVSVASATGTLEVTAVPEPSSVLGIGVACTIAAGVIRRRRNRPDVQT